MKDGWKGPLKGKLILFPVSKSLSTSVVTIAPVSSAVGAENSACQWRLYLWALNSQKTTDGGMVTHSSNYASTPVHFTSSAP